MTTENQKSSSPYSIYVTNSESKVFTFDHDGELFVDLREDYVAILQSSNSTPTGFKLKTLFYRPLMVECTYPPEDKIKPHRLVPVPKP